jgi:hypothetical protein
MTYAQHTFGFLKRIFGPGLKWKKLSNIMQPRFVHSIDYWDSDNAYSTLQFSIFFAVEESFLNGYHFQLCSHCRFENQV